MMEEPPGEQQLGTLVYWDKHRIPVNLTIIFALAVAVYGLWLTVRGAEGGAINPIFIVILGLGTALYSWLTNPRTYLIYTDALYVMYGRPRIKRLGFEDISHLEMRTLNTPDRLRVWPVRGRRVVLMARDPKRFTTSCSRPWMITGRPTPSCSSWRNRPRICLPLRSSWMTRPIGVTNRPRPAAATDAPATDRPPVPTL